MTVRVYYNKRRFDSDLPKWCVHVEDTCEVILADSVFAFGVHGMTESSKCLPNLHADHVIRYVNCRVEHTDKLVGLWPQEGWS